MFSNLRCKLSKLISISLDYGSVSLIAWETKNLTDSLQISIQCCSNLLDDLWNGHRSLSISSKFCSCIFWWSCSTRTELVQKWSLLVRIRTSMKRISKSEISLSKLLFRPDSGQIEEDLDEVQHELLSLTIFVLEELQQAQDQSEEDLIISYWFNITINENLQELNLKMYEV